MYTESTMILKGKYKFVRVSRVPDEYLLRIYSQKDKSDKELFAYATLNIDAIKERIEKGITIPELAQPCDKITFYSEKDAKAEINRIKAREQENKKPVRAYQCDVCGAWHLTSIAFENWDKDLK
jgi:hypothetical protein